MLFRSASVLVFGYGYKGEADFARSVFFVFVGLFLDTNPVVGFFHVFHNYAVAAEG